METGKILAALREKYGLTQEEMAARLFVTRQAVSRWERNETVPGPDTLLLISRTFDVSVNTLLGEPRKLICQCCGMPLDDDSISREPDGAFNESYCKWCYADGKFVYQSIEELIDFLADHMSNENWPREEARKFFSGQLPRLDHWKQ